MVDFFIWSVVLLCPVIIYLAFLYECIVDFFAGLAASNSSKQHGSPQKFGWAIPESFWKWYEFCYIAKFLFCPLHKFNFADFDSIEFPPSDSSIDFSLLPESPTGCDNERFVRCSREFVKSIGLPTFPNDATELLIQMGSEFVREGSEGLMKICK